MAQNEYRMDNRKIEDVRNQIYKLAKSYVPEWRFDENNPDIGSVIALIFANQLYGNIERFNAMLEKYHTEMVNLTDISLLPANPSKATVLMNVIPDTISGVKVKKGTKLLADSEDEKIIFETSNSVYISGAKLQAILMTSGKNGKIIPIYGNFKDIRYIEENVSEVTDETKSDDGVMTEFGLFDFSKNGIEKQAVLLYHDSIFDVENEILDCKISGNPKFLNDMEKGKFKILYYSDEGFLPVEKIKVVNEHIFFSKEKKSKKISVKGKEYSLVVIEGKEPQHETILLDSIEFSSSGSPREAEYVGNGTTDFDVSKFDIFGDTLSLYSECYIGMDSYFSKKDAKMTLTFNTKYFEKYVGLIKEEEKPDLRIIKRKNKYKQEEKLAYSRVQEITIEYFNGVGWKRLQCDKEYANIFSECEEGRIELSFICPKDWKSATFGGYQGRVLKVQLIKANNCYYQPSVHCYPEITDMSISYTYNDNYRKPSIGKRFFGTSVGDFTKELYENKSFIAFSKGNYDDTALYIGFDKVFDNGPVSLWWKIKDTGSHAERKLKFYYSTNSEFKEMKIVDYTENLSKTGIMLFLPNTDMGMIEIEGKKLCWLKIVNENNDEDKLYPIIEKIELNAVEVQNIETMEEEEFYIDTVRADMSFSIRADRLLDIDVWVNEKNELTKQDMVNMIQSNTDNVRVSLNYLGEIEEFYVKWEECSSFNYSKEYSRHYILDRMKNKIIFGDGVNVRIPKNTEGTAFKVQARCCNGKGGNVLANSITQSSSNIMFINNIYNPSPAYGGSDMERLEEALKRGADFFSSSGRLVTEKDYLCEIRNYCNGIKEAAIVMNVDRYGSYKEGMMHIILLMNDFIDGSESFRGIQNALKKHLLKHCEASILPEQLIIEEPLFVEFNVDVWVQIMNIEDSFEIQNEIEDILNKFLNPVLGRGKKGWEIGIVPRKSQIAMRLNSIKSKGTINNIMVTAKYSDNNGIHEVDLEELKINPFMVVKSGVHKTHLTQESAGR